MTVHGRPYGRLEGEALGNRIPCIRVVFLRLWETCEAFAALFTPCVRVCVCTHMYRDSCLSVPSVPKAKTSGLFSGIQPRKASQCLSHLSCRSGLGVSLVTSLAAILSPILGTNPVPLGPSPPQTQYGHRRRGRRERGIFSGMFFLTFVFCS
jgi:hypothetical protein